ncbi:hypothetical protein HDU76_001098 [Blyttiomyces sp. JEL0837]|nr:hypothetical protein HDU76_001098 [Blyttiomyces sp. JEL0837]
MTAVFAICTVCGGGVSHEYDGNEPEQQQVEITMPVPMLGPGKLVEGANLHRKKLGIEGSKEELAAGWKPHFDILNGELVSRISAHSDIKYRLGGRRQMASLPPLAV